MLCLLKVFTSTYTYLVFTPTYTYLVFTPTYTYLVFTPTYLEHSRLIQLHFLCVLEMFLKKMFNGGM